MCQHDRRRCPGRAWKPLSLPLACLFLLLLIPPSVLTISEPPPLRIGIIGTGIGGSTTAYFLRQLHNTTTTHHHIHLTLLEASHHIGGRVQSITADGHHLEAGASILHTTNQHLHNLSTTLHLTHTTPKKDNSRMAVWDHATSRFVFATSRWGWLNAVLMVWHYGLSVFRLLSRVEAVADKWQAVYGLQAAGRAFATPDALLGALGLYDSTQETLQAYLTPAVSPLLQSELVAAAERVNYNQPLTLNALAGSVGLVPMVDDRLWAVAGGNVRLVQGAVNASGAELLTAHRATSITYNSRAREYTVAGDGWQQQYDVVVLAVPLEQAGIELRLRDKLPKREYQATVATFVVGRINASYFQHGNGSGLFSHAAMPATILTAGCDQPPSGTLDTIRSLLPLQHHLPPPGADCPFSSSLRLRAATAAARTYHVQAVQQSRGCRRTSCWVSCSRRWPYVTRRWRGQAYPRFSWAGAVRAVRAAVALARRRGRGCTT